MYKEQFDQNSKINISKDETVEMWEKFSKKYEHPNPAVNKEWEILTCFDNEKVDWRSTDWHYYVPYTDNEPILNCDSAKCRIRSVKRLSDGEIFTISDLVQYHDFILPLKEFEFDSENNIMWVYAYHNKEWGNLFHARLNEIFKPQPTQERIEIEQTFWWMGKILYTQEQVNEIERKAFEAARKWCESGDIYRNRIIPIDSFYPKYETFNDYLNSKNKS